MEGLAEWLGRLQVRAGPMEGGAWLVPGWAAVQIGGEVRGAPSGVLSGGPLSVDGEDDD